MSDSVDDDLLILTDEESRLLRLRIRARRARAKRAERVEAGRCINSDSHGSATHGVLCESCRKTHRECRRSRQSKSNWAMETSS